MLAASGCGDGRFGPNDSVTREQSAVMLWRCAGSPAPQGLAARAQAAQMLRNYILSFE